MNWTISVPVTPFGKGRPRVTRRGQAYTPAKTRDKEDELKYFFHASKPPHFTGPLRVSIDCVFKKPKSAPKSRLHPTVKPDIDNLAKMVLDAGNHILWIDDTQIIDLHVMKSYGDQEKINIVVEEL